ncbi:hypothetical protein F0U60_16165 [Archangium minus]|uniref:Uncharacterized protein n=1 Tax=Archangium minus TaxID=83450 RepID=A0ABY9WQD8_9BACT|nr:hypothetical protein F0U60_16165 [Archangium minus]
MLASKWLFSVLKFVHEYYGILFGVAVLTFLAAGVLLRKAAPRAKAGGVLLVALLAAYVYLGVAGFDTLAVWVQRNGVEGEVLLSRQEPSNTFVNKRRLHNFVGFLKRRGSEELHPIEFLETNILQSPEVEGFHPRVGKTYPVRFVEAYPDFFVFDHGGAQGAALTQECYARSRRQPDLVARSQLKPGDAALQKELLENGTFIIEKCSQVF